MVKISGNQDLYAISQKAIKSKRPRVNQLLEKAFEKPVTLIVAGPGCGKTYATYTYLQDSDVQAIWIGLSETDNITSRFWETLCNSFSHLNKELSERIFGYGFPGNEELFRRFAESIWDVLKPRCKYVFVFDDIHLISDRSIKAFFIRCATYTVENLTSVFISREEVISPFLLDKYHIENVVIDESDLRFTKNEIIDYLSDLQVKTTMVLADELMTVTEGLAYLVNMAGKLLLKNHGEPQFVINALKTNITRLISLQFFDDLPDNLKKFAIKLPLIGHLSVSLLAELEDGIENMKELMRHSSLIYYDSYMCVYHLHHLLIDFLLEKQEHISEKEKAEVYEKGAAWCLDNGFDLEAISYLDKLGKYEDIIDLVLDMRLDIDYYIANYLINIIEQMPSDAFERYSNLKVIYARVLLSLGRITETIAIMQKYIAEEEAKPLTRESRNLLVGLYNNLGFANIAISAETRDYTFGKYFKKAAEYFDSENAEQIVTYSAVILPYACAIGYHAEDDSDLYIEAIETGAPNIYYTMRGFLAGALDLTKAEILLYKGEVAAAEKFAVTAAHKAKEHGQSDIEFRAYFFLIRVNLGLGKYVKLKEVLYQMEELTKRSTAANRFVLYEIFSSWFYLAIGQSEGAASWVKSDYLTGEAPSYVTGLEDLAKIKYYLNEKKYSVLQGFLSGLSPRTGLRRYMLGLVGLTAIEAACLSEMKERDEALAKLKEAYDYAYEGKYVFPFIELGNTMRTLAGNAIKSGKTGIPDEWLEMVRSRANTYAKRVAHVRSQYNEENNPEGGAALTTKEHAILQDLAQGLSRTEIAAGHGISVNTVKVVLQIIYDKLGAEHSIDAVKIALSRGLIQP
ncbi:MAG: LuxR C-terminal-related transcriptional regulator [Lachnospiraceae bacterium]|jgi:LuxR family maltose regulon positive regulatory protein|nr:LuxR C-terminal-related transcriptional regulator [Lachnospiraceae bacterium]